MKSMFGAVYFFHSKNPYIPFFLANKHGQIGLSKPKFGETFSIPRFCSFKVGISSISCGFSHSSFITNTGLIYTMGSNITGALGLAKPELTYCFSPNLVSSLSKKKASKISSGGGHTIALMGNSLKKFKGFLYRI